jgi:hypothetical protein
MRLSLIPLALILATAVLPAQALDLNGLRLGEVTLSFVKR